METVHQHGEETLNEALGGLLAHEMLIGQLMGQR